MKKKAIFWAIPFYVILFVVSLVFSRIGWKEMSFKSANHGSIWVPHDWEYHTDTCEFTNGDGELVMSVYYPNSEENKVQVEETENGNYIYANFSNSAGYQRGWFEVNGEQRLLSRLYFSSSHIMQIGSIVCWIWDPDIDLSTVERIVKSY